MNTKIKVITGSVVGAISTALLTAQAWAVTSTAEVATSFGSILETIVDEVTDVAITFLTNNWPLIAVISVTVGLVFFLYYKLRGAIRGK